MRPTPQGDARLRTLRARLLEVGATNPAAAVEVIAATLEDVSRIPGTKFIGAIVLRASSRTLRTWATRMRELP